MPIVHKSKAPTPHQQGYTFQLLEYQIWLEGGIIGICPPSTRATSLVPNYSAVMNIEQTPSSLPPHIMFLTALPTMPPTPTCTAFSRSEQTSSLRSHYLYKHKPGNICTKLIYYSRFYSIFAHLSNPQNSRSSCVGNDMATKEKRVTYQITNWVSCSLGKSARNALASKNLMKEHHLSLYGPLISKRSFILC